MAVDLYGWIEVPLRYSDDVWAGIIKVHPNTFGFNRSAFRDSLITNCDGNGLPENVSEQVKTDPNLESAFRSYYVMWDNVWKVDIEDADAGWWMLYALVAELVDVYSGQPYKPSQIRFVFWVD